MKSVDRVQLSIDGHMVFDSGSNVVLDRLNEIAALIIVQGDRMAATVQQMLDTMTAISGSLTNIAADIQVLKDKVGGGGVVTQEELENMLVQAQAAAQQASDLDTSNPPPFVQ